MEIITAPVPAQSPFIPADAKIVVGAVAPASPDPIPIVLLPGFEYRMREWRHPSTHEIHWRLERRKSARRPTTTTTRNFDQTQSQGQAAGERAYLVVAPQVGFADCADVQPFAARTDSRATAEPSRLQLRV